MPVMPAETQTADAALTSLITRWKEDPGGAYRAWFLWDQRVKNFRSIRAGIAALLARMHDVAPAGAMVVQGLASTGRAMLRIAPPVATTLGPVGAGRPVTATVAAKRSGGEWEGGSHHRMSFIPPAGLADAAGAASGSSSTKCPCD